MNAPRTTMFTRATTFVVLAAAGAVFGPSAWAGEHQLEFKLVTMAIEVKSFEAANVEGQNVAPMKARGVGYLKDGRIAAKDFIHSADVNKGSARSSATAPTPSKTARP